MRFSKRKRSHHAAKAGLHDDTSVRHSVGQSAPPSPEIGDRPVRQLNTVLLVGTVVFFSVLLVAAYFWRERQVNHMASAFLKQASSLETQEKWSKAAGYIHQYLQIRPDDGATRIRLAKTYEKSAENVSGQLRAIDLYYEALGLAPEAEAPELRRRLARLLLNHKRYLEAKSEAAKTLSYDRLAKGLEREGESMDRLKSQIHNRLRANAAEVLSSEVLARLPLEDLLDVLPVEFLVRQLPDSDLEAMRVIAWAQYGEYLSEVFPTDKLSVIGKAFLVANALEIRRGEAELEFSVALARIYRDRPELLPPKADDSALSHNEAADQCVAYAMKVHAQDPSAHLANFSYRKQYELAGAEQSLARAAELAPEDPRVLTAMAEWALHQAVIATSPSNRAASEAQPEPSSAEHDVAERYREAERCYKLLVEKAAPKSEASHLGLGQVYVAQKKWDEALAAWETGLKMIPDGSLAVSANLVELLIQQNQPTKAREVFLGQFQATYDVQRIRVNRAVQLKFDLTGRYLQGALEFADGDPHSAIPYLEEVVRTKAGEAEQELQNRARLLLARAFSATAQWDAAATQFEALARLLPNDVGSRLSAAAAWAAADRADRAKLSYEEALQRLVPADGDLSSASTEYRRLVAETYLALAQAYLQAELALPYANRDWTLFLHALQQSRAISQTVQFENPWRQDMLEAESWLARAEGATDDAQRNAALEQGVQIVQATQQAYGDDAELAERLVIAYEHLHRPQQADESLQSLAALGDAASVAQTKAKLLSLRGRHREAQQTLREFLATAGADRKPQLLSTLARLAVSQGEPKQAYDYLAAMYGPLPKRDGTGGNNPGQRKENPVLIQQLADAALMKENLRDALIWESELQRIEGGNGCGWRSCRVRRLLLEAQSTKPRLPKVEREKKWDQAEVLAQQIIRRRPEWSEGSLLRGMLHEVRGEVDQAIAAYERAVSLGERRANVFEKLFLLLAQRNRFTEAQHYALLLKERGKFSTNLEQAEVSLTARQDLAAAVALARQNVERRPTDSMTHVWFGTMLMLSEQHEAAEQAFVKARELAPEDARVWNALFSFHLRTGRTDDARQTLTGLAEHAKLSEAEKAFVLAQGWQLLGEAEKAGEAFRKAEQLASDRPNVIVHAARFHLRQGQMDEAESALRAVLRKSSGDAALQRDPHIVETRRLLAALLANRGGEDEFAEAIRLLVDSGGDRDISEFDRRLQAMLYMERRGKDSNRTRDLAMAQQIMERAVVAGEATPADRLLLARIYERQARVLARKSMEASDNQSSTFRDEERQKVLAARREYLGLVEKAVPDAAHLALFIDFLLRQQGRFAGRDIDENKSLEAARRVEEESEEFEEWLKRHAQALDRIEKPSAVRLAEYIELRLRLNQPNEAEPWLAPLAAADTSGLISLSMRVRWHHARGERDAVRDLIEPFANKKLAEVKTDEQREELYARVGSLYALVDHQAAAEAWFRKLHALRPARFDMLAACLAKQNRAAEAIQLCDTEEAKESDLKRLLTIAEALATADLSKVDAAPFEADFAKALREHPEQPQLALAIGNVRVAQGRRAEAIQLYEQVLDADPENVAALNNLATVLADGPNSLDRARKYVDRAIGLAGPHPALYDTKGTILLLDGNAREAMELLEIAARSPGADPRFTFHLALAHHRLNDLENARRRLDEARQRDLDTTLLTSGDEERLRELETALGGSPESTAP